jgi:hypothetical protein
VNDNASTDDAKEKHMLPTSTLTKETNDKLPMDRQVIEVRLGTDQWQPAMFRDGEFVDMYGIPLERRKISSWRPAKANAMNHA